MTGCAAAWVVAAVAVAALAVWALLAVMRAFRRAGDVVADTRAELADSGDQDAAGDRFDRLRALIEWVSERDHGRAVELDQVVHEIERHARRPDR